MRWPNDRSARHFRGGAAEAVDDVRLSALNVVRA